MHHTSILIVDDDPTIRLILERILKKDGYLVDTSGDGQDALEKILRGNYALVLLDLNMMPVDGMQILTTLREKDVQSVVIILTAHSSIESAVEALRLGAFDYLFKPASPETIRQRVRDGVAHYEKNQRRSELLRQLEQLRGMLKELDSAETPKPDDTQDRFLHSGSLVIDRHHRIVTFVGQLLELTTTEFNLLLCLVEASPNPVNACQLVSSALSYECNDTEAREIVKWHIHHLRKKVEPDPARPTYIKTVRYLGYIWSGN